MAPMAHQFESMVVGRLNSLEVKVMTNTKAIAEMEKMLYESYIVAHDISEKAGQFLSAGDQRLGELRKKVASLNIKDSDFYSAEPRGPVTIVRMRSKGAAQF